MWHVLLHAILLARLTGGAFFKLEGPLACVENGGGCGFARRM